VGTETAPIVLVQRRERGREGSNRSCPRLSDCKAVAMQVVTELPAPANPNRNETRKRPVQVDRT